MVSAMSELRRGSTGHEVEWLQTWLRQLAFYQGPIDGDFGPGTEQGVLAYREWRGVGDGDTADDELQAMMAADAEQYADATGEAADDPNAGVRQAALAAAYAEIGLVRAKEAGEVDETGQHTRYGWERLREYFSVAAPGIWPEDTVKYLKPGLPSWCGIFALWALKTGGASVGDWGMGTGIPGIRQVRDPKPGDIGYLEQNQHYCLIHSVDGDTVHSIDGNTVGDDTSGGEVNDRTRSRGEYLGFFTVFD
jgi:peptidoglycan hydrolase-like protein with peptidoglycan-binding domain